ncbi:MAG: hypothetical protein Q9208_000311 [Pyrenodesmia sp. 3 TL-2023]
MQAPSLPIGPWGCRNERQDTFPSIGQYGSRFNFASNFDFRDLSMNKAPTDYFNLKPVRGSSPTASLAADLSQNFHIDQSPQLPTPRRALFSSNLFGTLTGRGRIRMLEYSAMSSQDPSKRNYAPTAVIFSGPRERLHGHIALASQSTIPLNHSNTVAITHTGAYAQQRSRAKGHSTTSVSLKTVKVDNPVPTFQFGNGSSQLANNLTSLDECFTASPPQERRPSSANSPMASLMGPPKLRQPFSNLHMHSRSNASPILGHVRKPSSSSGQRPRKQFRRSLSMFEHPGDVMKEQQSKFSPAEGLSSIMDTDDNPQVQLNLPHFMADEESVPRITKETMVDVLDGKYRAPFENSLIVDCRFEYEYEGGHIDGAINVNSKEELASKLFEPVTSGRTLIVFHCEYSAHRAPLM